MEVGGKGIEDLTSICEISLQGVNRGVGERIEVKVEYRVTF